MRGNTVESVASDGAKSHRGDGPRWVRPNGLRATAPKLFLDWRRSTMTEQGHQIVVGEPAPDFELPATNGDTFRLSTLHGKSNVVLVFLRGFQ